MQLPPHCCVPHAPQPWDCPGEQAPWFVQAPQSPHWQSGVQLFMCVPQFAQGSDCVWPTMQTPWFSHCPHGDQTQE
jgi:hypothetical protein